MHELKNVLALVDRIADQMKDLDPMMFRAAMCLLFDEYGRTHADGYDPAMAAAECAALVHAVNAEMWRMEPAQAAG